MMIAVKSKSMEVNQGQWLHSMLVQLVFDLKWTLQMHQILRLIFACCEAYSSLQLFVCSCHMEVSDFISEHVDINYLCLILCLALMRKFHVFLKTEEVIDDWLKLPVLCTRSSERGRHMTSLQYMENLFVLSYHFECPYRSQHRIQACGLTDVCTYPSQCSLSPFPWDTTFMQITLNSSSPFTHPALTSALLTYKMLFNRSLPGWLQIF